MKQSEIYMEYLYETGRRCYEDLSTEQVAKLTGHIMNESCKQARAEFVCDSDLFNDLTHDIADYLISISSSTEKFIEVKERLLTSIAANSTFYAKKTINNLFEGMVQDEAFERRFPNEYDSHKEAA